LTKQGSSAARYSAGSTNSEKSPVEISDFTPGVTYRMTIVPYLDCEPGEEIYKILTVLEPASAQNSRADDGDTLEVPAPQLLEEWRKFLRVRDPAGNVRLQWPGLVTKATPLPLEGNAQ
jgi:hypothetical protein